jgi:hypothetical protein
LPNVTPIILPADFSKDFEVDLGDTMAQKRPRWAAYGICKDTADTTFPPLPKNATIDTPRIIVDTFLNKITPSHPCLMTVTDAANKKYQFVIRLPVPWPLHPSPTGVDPTVMSCVDPSPSAEWCRNMNEISTAEPRFALLTPPSNP